MVAHGQHVVEGYGGVLVHVVAGVVATVYAIFG
jgi:hypothetical protein